jgi:hypothetical protein
MMATDAKTSLKKIDDRNIFMLLYLQERTVTYMLGADKKF